MLPPDATPITTEQLLQKIGEQSVLIDVLREQLRIIKTKLEAERKEAVDNLPYSQPVRIPQSNSFGDPERPPERAYDRQANPLDGSERM